MTILKTTDIRVQHAENTQSLSFPDLSIHKGDKILLLGSSGCGKTTLLSVIAGLLPPATGHVTVNDTDFYALTSKERDVLRGQIFGFVFQNLHLLPALTLRQNIMLAADMSGVSVPTERLEKLLSSLGLTDKANRKPSELSQGEQQRAALARAVLNSPALIIADEPTSALDDKNADAVMDLLERQSSESGAALLVATHDNRIKHRFDTIITLSPSLNKEAA